MTPELLLERAAEARADRYRNLTDRPARRAAAAGGNGIGAVVAPGAWRVEVPPSVAERDAAAGDPSAPTVSGFASVTEVPYQMFDLFGPYTEVVSRDAFDVTLAGSPLVEFTINHARGGSIPMAHTRNGTLDLSAIKDGETTGLWYDARVDPTRTDVADAVKALARGDLAESSFKFTITKGLWSPDYTEFRINEVDLSRGDVSAVNFGANPNATALLRSDLEELFPGSDLRALIRDALAEALRDGSGQAADAAPAAPVAPVLVPHRRVF